MKKESRWNKRLFENDHIVPMSATATKYSISFRYICRYRPHSDLTSTSV